MTPPFPRVLVANRGEIACRIITTLDRLGIESIGVHSEPDRAARHVAMATHAWSLGGTTPASSYLRIDAVIDAAVTTGAEAVHPGYGLLSESVAFAEACEAAGLVFLGPTVEQIKSFALKHRARDLADAAGVPVVPGSGALADLVAARSAASDIGFPVMLKASAGGGGIGMRVCADETELDQAYESVARLAENNFADPTLLVERFVAAARHVEVQLIGDGQGAVTHVGDRDCSAQRRRQKVIEEAPAPCLPDALRERLQASAVALGKSVDYRSAGTVEFVVDDASIAGSSDAEDGEAYFLEVNTRLQVEHGVTEVIDGIDLVEWMVCIGAGETLAELGPVPEPSGAAIEARIYAEDPADAYLPSSGLITAFDVPDDVRCDTWIQPGTQITPFYDPLLAKVIVTGGDRLAAIDRLTSRLEATEISGVATNIGLLHDTATNERFRERPITTTELDDYASAAPEMKVVDGGLFTTVQDADGRTGYWHVGIPPSGSMDPRSHRLVNELLGNDPNTTALEITMLGPTLEFRSATRIVLGGAACNAELDGEPVSMWTPTAVEAGSQLVVGPVVGPGARSYLGVAGGIPVPDHLGSAATFALGGFGGHSGRPLRAGDVVPIAAFADEPLEPTPEADVPSMTNEWVIDVVPGPHAAPEYFTEADIETLYGTRYEVHFHSDRTGVRLIGPTPEWARADGGQAGLHPSNINDNAYAIGAIDFTGDMPIILGRDGPSLGGFVCPATVTEEDFWKVGQLRAGDGVRFVPATAATAGDQAPIAAQRSVLADVANDEPKLTVRRCGDAHLLVEYGDDVLDLVMRARVEVLTQRLAGQPGLGELVPGVRSLQVEFDPATTSEMRVIDQIHAADQSIGAVEDLVLPSRIVHLPMSWDDPTARQAAEKYAQVVRPDAPWCPWNLEFIRRINGLDSVDDVKRIVFDASYLVMGLGDVYLGAPVATPVDPRHRLVTTKYNPSRTWTAENAVGIGGSYLCIYGMEGPGGYQLVGRTVPIWDRWHRWADHDEAGAKPWLLRTFDQIRWYEVTEAELEVHRAAAEAGTFNFAIERAEFSVADYMAHLETNADSIAAFESMRQAAFDAERQRWADDDVNVIGTVEPTVGAGEERVIPAGATPIVGAVSGVVWEVSVEPGDVVAADQRLGAVEAMKMESEITASVAGEVVAVFVAPGDITQAGDPLFAIQSVSS